MIFVRRADSDSWENFTIGGNLRSYGPFNTPLALGLSLSRRLPTIIHLYQWAKKKHFVSLKTKTRTEAPPTSSGVRNSATTAWHTCVLKRPEIMLKFRGTQKPKDLSTVTKMITIFEFKSNCVALRICVHWREVTVNSFQTEPEIFRASYFDGTVQDVFYDVIKSKHLKNVPSTITDSAVLNELRYYYKRNSVGIQTLTLEHVGTTARQRFGHKKSVLSFGNYSFILFFRH